MWWRLRTAANAICVGAMALLGGMAWHTAIAQDSGDSDMQRAHSALQQGRLHKGNGNLDAAVGSFRQALTHAADGSNVRAAAKDELDYYLPLMHIQRLLWRGQTAAAERRLQGLQEKFSVHPERLAAIVRILNEIRAPVENPDSSTPADERVILRQAKTSLARYFSHNKRYPQTGKELKQVLGVGQGVFSGFVVARYLSTGSGYLLELRSSRDPEHTLTLHSTGLLQ